MSNSENQSDSSSEKDQTHSKFASFEGNRNGKV